MYMRNVTFKITAYYEAIQYFSLSDVYVTITRSRSSDPMLVLSIQNDLSEFNNLGTVLTVPAQQLPS